MYIYIYVLNTINMYTLKKCIYDIYIYLQFTNKLKTFLQKKTPCRLQVLCCFIGSKVAEELEQVKLDQQAKFPSFVFGPVLPVLRFDVFLCAFF